MRRRLIVILGVVLVGAAALWYLSAPPKGADGYRERAASTAATIHSQVQLARVWVESREDGETTGAATLVGLEEVEGDALSAAAAFGGHEPPSGLLGLRSELDSLASDATDALAALRIAAQQEEWMRSDVSPSRSLDLPIA